MDVAEQEGTDIMKRFKSLAVLTAVVSLAVAGCGGTAKTSTPTKAPTPSTLTSGLPSENEMASQIKIDLQTKSNQRQDEAGLPHITVDSVSVVKNAMGARGFAEYTEDGMHQSIAISITPGANGAFLYETDDTP
jgi:hypothetical protein